MDDQMPEAIRDNAESAKEDVEQAGKAEGGADGAQGDQPSAQEGEGDPKVGGEEVQPQTDLG